MFPSPHGDKFQRKATSMGAGASEFPSPHGDKFQLQYKQRNGLWGVAFPSPHGDKFQPAASYEQNIIDKFPSPHGDKFQRGERGYFNGRREFPSPHGDKFQPAKGKKAIRGTSFRPLTGINFNARKREKCYRMDVSVPSRG